MGLYMPAATSHKPNWGSQNSTELIDHEMVIIKYVQPDVFTSLNRCT